MNNTCENCNVEVSSDLKYCPLCGKCLNNKIDKAEENGNSFPIIDQSYIFRAKWLKVIKEFSILIALILIAINLIFWTKPLWFPYPLLAIFVAYLTIFYPFGDDKNHIKCLPFTGLWISIFIVCIDIYSFLVSKTTFGWGLFFVAPFILAGFTLIGFILALCLRKEELNLTKGLLLYAVIETIFIVFKLIFFKSYATWPIFMSLCMSILGFSTIIIFKNKRLRKEMNRNFHI